MQATSRAFQFQSPQPESDYLLSNAEIWITYRGENLIRLSQEYRPVSPVTCSVSGTTFVIGCASGHVLF
ncbi:hypothetical protein BDV06DRAFT_188204, partial [Aspergillus oleicola]